MSWYTKKSTIFFFFFFLVCHEKINLYFSFRQVANYGGGRASASPNPMSVNVTSNRPHDQSASNRPQDRMMQLQEQRRQIEQRTVASTHNSRKNFLNNFFPSFYLC